MQGPEDKQVSDQNLHDFVIVDDKGEPVGPVQDGDAVVLFNFRADRMVEISKAFEYADFNVFDRVRYPKDLKFVGMMQYDGDLKLPANFLVPPPEILKVRLGDGATRGKARAVGAGLRVSPGAGAPLLTLCTAPLQVSGEYLAKNGISTFACSETQKFGHVT